MHITLSHRGGGAKTMVGVEFYGKQPYPTLHRTLPKCHSEKLCRQAGQRSSAEALQLSLQVFG